MVDIYFMGQAFKCCNLTIIKHSAVQPVEKLIFFEDLQFFMAFREPLHIHCDRETFVESFVCENDS